MQEPKKANLDLQRTQLLDVAAYLFATKGFHATGMRELARHLKIKAGSLYYHINSKDQLLNEVCEIGMQRLSFNIDRSLASNNRLPETIRSIVIGHVDLIRQYGSYLNCYQNDYVHLAEEIRERMRLYLVAFHRKIEEVFKRAISNGETRPDLSIRNARLAVISILHQLSLLGSEPHNRSLDKTAEGLSEILIYGLALEHTGQASSMEAPLGPNG